MDQHPLANRGPLASALPLQARVARGGVRFTNAFTVLPVCSPARASMLTGQYPHAHGLTENDGRFGGRSGLGPDDWMVHQPFAASGYRTAWFGKWHLSNQSDAGGFGFEGWSLPGYGYPYGADAYADYLARMGLPQPIAEIEAPGESRTPRGARFALTDLDAWPDYEAGAYRLDGPSETHEAFFVADLASDWIARNADAPFFLRVDPWGPHPPYMVSSEFDGALGETDFRTPNFHADLAGRPDHHRAYRDEWTELGWSDADWRLLARRSLEQAALVETAMRRVLDSLDRAGIAGRTIAIVTADHGDAVASNGGVANKGGLLVEETVKIPLLIKGPALPDAGVCDRIVTNLDIAPFLLKAASLDAPCDLHGRDLGDMVGARGSPAPEGAMLQHYGLHDPIVQRCWRTERWKLILQEGGFCELYDMRRDPNELRNLASDPAFAATRKALSRSLFAEMAHLGDEGAAAKLGA